MSPDHWVAVDIAVIVDIGTFRTVLKGLRRGGERWWLACDLPDAPESGSVIVGFGEPLCSDRLNCVFFRIPTLDVGTSGLPDEVYLVIAPALIEHLAPESRALPDCRARDFVGDFERFFFPLKQALIERLQAAGTTR